MGWKIPEKYRAVDLNGQYFSRRGEPFGAFYILSPDASRVTRTVLYAIASNGMDGIDWEHVSVRAVKQLGPKQFKNLTPTWDEMCFVKSLFWDEEDCVLQFHPAKSDYINVHPNVLHLYRPTKLEIPMPPKITV